MKASLVVHQSETSGSLDADRPVSSVRNAATSLHPYRVGAPVRGAMAIVFLAHALFYFIALGYDAVDDAYISFRYAQNAILGIGLVFNPGERVEGFTNFLWTALMIPVVGAGLDVGRVSIILGILFGLGTLWLTAQLARSLQLPRWVGWFAALLLAVDGSFAIWSVSGLETALFTFLLTAGATLYVLEQRATDDMQRTLEVHRTLRLPPSAIMFALAAMTRPEAAAVFALTVVHQLAWRVIYEVRRIPRGLPTVASEVRRTLFQPRTLLELFPRTDIMRGLTFAALFVPYWLLRWRYYYSFFPNSFYAKVAPGGPLAQLERGWHYVTQFVDVHLGWGILLPALVALTVAAVRYSKTHTAETGEPDRAALFGMTYFALAIVAYGAYIVYVGGDWSVGRFFVPVLPLAYLMIAAGLGEIYRWIESLRFRAESRNDSRLVRVTRYAAAAAAAVLLAALAFASSWNGEYGIFVRGFDAATATAARETMGRWLKANVPPGTLIAVDAAGQVPYFSGLPAIDMFGINDLHIGRLSIPTLGEGTPGHEKFDLAYIITRAPRFVVIYGTLFDTVSEYRRAAVEWTGDDEFKKFLTIYERK
jgi:arabinofuranosyltransferase